MKIRVSISGLMIAVAWIAVDGMALRTIGSMNQALWELLGVCVLPMANVLGATLLRVRAGRCLGRPRPFAAGFVAAGTVALVLYLVLILAFPDATSHAYELLLDHLKRIAPQGRFRVPALLALFLVWTQAPILVPALAGGFFLRLWRRPAALGPGAGIPRPRGIEGPEAVGTRLAGFGRRD